MIPITNYSLPEFSDAAIKIQSAFRGYRIRKRTGLLPKGVREQVKTLLQSDYRTEPKAKNGRTPVYFPTHFPGIVLKISREYSHQRLCQMVRVRQSCEQLGCSSLVIPKALLSRDSFRQHLLIEERLPIKTDMLDQIDLYMTHLEEFTLPIKEFTRVVLKTGLEDLVGRLSLFDYKGPRYDNFPLFIDEKGKCKIGLIDLESANPEGFYSGLITDLVYIFPYHYETILNVAKEMGVHPDFLDLNSKLLLQNNEEGKRFIKVRYTDYKIYTATRDNDVFMMTTQQATEIIDEIVREQGYHKEGAVSILMTFLTEARKLLEKNHFVHHTAFLSCSYFLNIGLLPYMNQLDDKATGHWFPIQILLAKMVEKKIIYGYCIRP